MSRTADGARARLWSGNRKTSRPIIRKLVAIVAADVAGYSRLMGVDEEGTLARLTAHRRELIDPAIANAALRTAGLPEA